MSELLAIHGGPKAKTTPNYPMYPGGLEIGEDEKKEVMEVLDNKYLFRYYGPSNMPSKVRAFENAFKEKFGSPYALATSSCTGALISALVACGVGPGDEVLVTGYTFFASCASIVAAKAMPMGGASMFALLALCGDVGCSVGPQITAFVSESFGNNMRIGFIAALIFPIIIGASCVSFMLKNKKTDAKKSH